MATIRRFEDIEAWQRARTLTHAIYDVSKQGPFGRDFPLRDQIRRAGISIMSNIAEGFERDGAVEFAQFLSTAKASAAEVRSQLYIALGQHYIDERTFNQLMDLADETGRMIAGFMQYLRSTSHRGTKYRSTSAPPTRNSKPGTRNLP